MKNIETLEQVLVEDLKDIYSAERQLLKALPKLEKKASNEKLKSLISAHLKETETQVARLEKIESLMGVKLSGKACKAMQGLVEEGQEVIEKESKNDSLIDTMLIGGASRVEHYEMAAYQGAIKMALELGEDQVAELLQESLNEEKLADKKLCELCDKEILSDANVEDFDHEVAASSKSRRSGSSDNRSGALKALAIGGLISVCALNPSLGHSDTQTDKMQRDTQVSAPAYGREVAPDADNTEINRRDSDGRAVTADDQALSGKDLELLALIRRKIVANDDLSTYAKNVKVMLHDGIVTLRGPVRTAEEKSWIEQTSIATATGYRVRSEIQVEPS